MDNGGGDGEICSVTTNGDKDPIQVDTDISTLLPPVPEMKNVKTQVNEIKRKKKDEPGPNKKKAKKSKSGSSPPTLVPVPSDDESVNAEPEEEPGSIELGNDAFEWMIYPTDVSKFYAEYWEKKPLLIKRPENRDRYKKANLFSTKALDKILREQRVLYGKNLDVTSYDGQRETHNPEGRVYPAVLWDFYNNGCSIRMLNPQTFHAGAWRLCSTLQEHFQTMVGANVYLTPPGTQGFAPHYDDVEVFLLQLEGKKHWKLHKSRSEEEKLPRFSSGNFSQEEVGPPFMEMDLEPGDLLYLPRGTIHQGNCLEDQHSLHITISTYQLNSWTDLLDKLLPGALAVASQENIEFRKGLPRDYLLNMGVVHEDKQSKSRKEFIDHVKTLMKKLIDHAPIDAAVDQLGKRMTHDVLPPAMEMAEKVRTVAQDGERWHASKSSVVNRVEIDPTTCVRSVDNYR